MLSVCCVRFHWHKLLHFLGLFTNAQQDKFRQNTIPHYSRRFSYFFKNSVMQFRHGHIRTLVIKELVNGLGWFIQCQPPACVVSSLSLSLSLSLCVCMCSLCVVSTFECVICYPYELPLAASREKQSYRSLNWWRIWVRSETHCQETTNWRWNQLPPFHHEIVWLHSLSQFETHRSVIRLEFWASFLRHLKTIHFQKKNNNNTFWKSVVFGARMEVEQRFPRMQLVRKAAEQYQRLIMDCTRPTLAIHQQQVTKNKKKGEKKKTNSKPFLEKIKISIPTDKSRLNFEKAFDIKMGKRRRRNKICNLRVGKDRGQLFCWVSVTVNDNQLILLNLLDNSLSSFSFLSLSIECHKNPDHTHSLTVTTSFWRHSKKKQNKKTLWQRWKWKNCKGL